ncbi:MAG: cytochrome c biogenesis protein ResB [Chloroflexi bacterium]|nr:cytochrome c biogenesis protein ResB [Chloroflexota bacterium]
MIETTAAPEHEATSEPNEPGAPRSADRPEPKFDLVDQLWSLFSSTKLALALIFAIIAACLAGALIVQAPNELLGNSDAVRTWIERVRPRFGFWTDVFAGLGLFWVFQTVWFRVLLGLLTVNTLVCTTNRFPAIWRQVFKPVVRPSDALFERGQPREVVRLSGSSTSSAATTVRRALSRRGYRVEESERSEGTYFYADRNRFARFGTVVTHSGLLLVLLGAVLQGPLGFFEESGFAVPIGSTREVGHDTGLAVSAEDFADEYHPDGRPKDYRSILVLFENGREVARQTVRVNEPLSYGGVRFHQSYYGQSALVAVTDRNGKSLYRDAVALTWRSNDGNRPVGYFFLPNQNLHVYLVGTSGEGDGVVKPGEILVEAYQGQTPQPTHRATLTQRRPNSVGELQFVFERELPFTGLRVVRDPGAVIIWLACMLIVIGPVVTFYFPHRRLWLRARADGGTIAVTVVGAGRALTDDVRRLAGDLTDSPAKTEAPRGYPGPRAEEAATSPNPQSSDRGRRAEPVVQSPVRKGRAKAGAQPAGIVSSSLRGGRDGR